MDSRLVKSTFLLALAATPVPALGQSASPALPAPIAAAFRQAYPAATILHAAPETRDGHVVYEIESKDGTMWRDLLYSLSGEIIEIEEILPVDSLPAPVRTAVGKDAPRATIVGVERVTTGTAIAYEVRVRRNGRTRSLTYDAEGGRQP